MNAVTAHPTIMTELTPDAIEPTRGILFILSGPSGVGKDTILDRALAKMSKIRASISVTTRPPRPGEQHGVDYFFVPPDEFALMLERGEFLEHAGVHGYFYGTPRTWVDEELRTGMDVVLEIDVQGAVQVRRLFPQAILIFLAPPSWEELSRRLLKRLEHDRKLAHDIGAREAEDEATIRKRLANARQELARVDQYEYLIVNDKLAEATEQFCAIVIAERCRPWRQDIERLLKEDPTHG